MFNRTSYRSGFILMVIIMLTVMLPFTAWSSGSRASMVKKPSILEGRTLISDKELDDMRGRYDSYYFGLDINVNLASGTPSVNLVPHSNNTPGTSPDPSGRGYNYKDGSVAWQGGIGEQSVYQTAQVSGNGKMVTGIVNLNITIPQSLLTIGSRDLNVLKAGVLPPNF